MTPETKRWKTAEYKAELAAKRQSFLDELGMREFKWSLRNVRGALGLAGAQKPRVDAVIDRVFGGRSYGFLGNHSGVDNVFDHYECFGRAGKPLFLIGFPYDVSAGAMRSLSAIESLGLDVKIDGRSWYGYGTVRVVVTHWETVRGMTAEHEKVRDAMEMILSPPLSIPPPITPRL